MMLEALADKLQAASIATAGVDMFIGLMPSSPDVCVALYEYAGEQPLEVLRDNDATLERPSVQVMARASRNDYPTARALIESVRDSLTDITDETISGVRFLRVNQNSSINAVGTDENDRPLFTLSLLTVVER
jgi:hypothetical protein